MNIVSKLFSLASEIIKKTYLSQNEDSVLVGEFTYDPLVTSHFSYVLSPHNLFFTYISLNKSYADQGNIVLFKLFKVTSVL